MALAGLLFFVYRTFPNTAVRTRPAATATVFVAVLWEVARWGFSTYLTMFGVYGKLYGSFGVVVATLVWIYRMDLFFRHHFRGGGGDRGDADGAERRSD